MQYVKFENDYVLRIDRGEEIVEAVKEFAKAEGIKLASLSGIGAVNKAVVGLFDTREKKYFTNFFNRELEITNLTGSITEKDGEPYAHLHVSLADINGNMYGGHLNEAVVSGTAEIVAHIIDGRIERKFSEEIGLNLLKF